LGNARPSEPDSGGINSPRVKSRTTENGDGNVPSGGEVNHGWNTAPRLDLDADDNDRISTIYADRAVREYRGESYLTGLF